MIVSSELSVPSLVTYTGTGIRTPDDFRGVLYRKGVGVELYASDMLGKTPHFPISDATEVYGLELVTVEDMGIYPGATRGRIYEVARKRGLELCPSEMGPQFCLQHGSLIQGPIVVGMEPIYCTDGKYRLFVIKKGNDGEMCLDSIESGYPGQFIRGDTTFLFVRP